LDQAGIEPVIPVPLSEMGVSLRILPVKIFMDLVCVSWNRVIEELIAWQNYFSQL